MHAPELGRWITQEIKLQYVKMAQLKNLKWLDNIVSVCIRADARKHQLNIKEKSTLTENP